MNLREYITQALDDVSGALADHLHKHADGQDLESKLPHGATVEQAIKHQFSERLGDIVFDVSTTVTESNEKSGKAGIKVISGDIKKSEASEAVQRIQVTIRALKPR